MPAAQAFQAVFFFLEFGDGELAFGNLLVDFGVEFVAVGEELGPLLAARLGEPGVQAGAVGLAAASGVEQHDLAGGGDRGGEASRAAGQGQWPDAPVALTAPLGLTAQ